MAKKKSPKEIIESEKKPKYESAYVKFSGEELVQIPIVKKSRFGVQLNEEVFEKATKKHKKPYSFIHTHPSILLNLVIGRFIGTVVPSPEDLETFLKNEKMKNMIIAQRDTKTGEVGGYLYVRKPNNYNSQEIDVENKTKWKMAHKKGKIPAIMEEYGLEYKLLPAKGYELGGSGDKFVEKGDRSLEKTLISIITISGIISGIFFLSPNLTGNAISNLTNQTSNMVGGGLFILGIVGSYFYFRGK